MNPLTDDEAALVYHTQHFGSAGYPVEKRGRGWVVRDWRSVRGAPKVFRTKRDAVAAFEAWHSMALERWRETRQANQILTAVGVVTP